MNTKKIMTLISILYKNTSKNDDQLLNLYHNVLDQDNDVKKLSDCLNNYRFFDEGNTLREKSEKCLNYLRNPENDVVHWLDEVKVLLSSINDEIIKSNKLLKSPRSFSEKITIIRNNEIEAQIYSLRIIAAVCVYLIALCSGVKALEDLTWKETSKIQELLQIVNSYYLPKVEKLQYPKKWVVVKTLQNKNMFFEKINGFYLKYIDCEVEKAENNKKQLTDYAYFYPDSWNYSQGKAVICSGSGNLLSIPPERGLEFLSVKVAKKLRIPGEKEYAQPVLDPHMLLYLLSEGNEYCISPMDLVISLNQWSTGYELKRRKEKRECLICGKTLKNKSVICDNHFVSEL